MRKMNLSVLLVPILLVALQGCGTPPAPTQPPAVAVASETPLPPTAAPTATETLVPSPTPLPGALVLPVESLGKSKPWLPLDKSAVPAAYFFYFNLEKPPFNSVLVRQAFAAAVDREALVAIAQKYGNKTAKPATTITPPETLGRDLYNQVGIPFDPTHAKALLAEAGYTDPAKFPAVTLLTNVSGEPAPAAHQKIAEAMVQMWQQYLNVKVTFQVLAWGPYLNRIGSSPSEIFRLGWSADVNDPDNFLRELFSSGSQYDYGHFSDSNFDLLVDRAKNSYDPAQRQQLYIEAERILCAQQAAVIPIYHWSVVMP